MRRPWLLVLLALACALAFPPLGLLAAAGGSLYAHRTGYFGLRNLLFALFAALLLILAVLAPPN